MLPMRYRSIILLLTFTLLFELSAFGQKVTLEKPLNDGSGQFAQKVVGLFNPSPIAASKQKAMEPFVIGYFGWKALRYANLGVGKIEAIHLDFCLAGLQMYDNELEPTIKAIQARAKSPTDWLAATADEKAKIRAFVVTKHGGKYIGIGRFLDPSLPEPNKEETWRYNLGSLLGETGADITLWYIFPNNAGFDKAFGERIGGLTKNINEASAATPPDLINKLKALAALGNKPKYTLADRQRVNEAFIAAVDATLMLAYLPATPSSTAQPVKPVMPQATPRPTGTNSTTPSKPANSQNNTSTNKSQKQPLPSLSKIAPASTRGRADQLLNQGKELAAAKRFDEAITKFSDAAKIDPQYASVYFNRALAYSSQALYDKAINDANTYVMLNPNDSLGYYNRGTFYLAKNSYAMARDDFSKGVALAPKDQRIIYNRGIANYHLADYDKAEADFSTALMLDTKYINAYISRALVHCKKGRPLSAVYDQESAIRLGANITKGCPK